MAKLKVFVSSTCYDLGILRSEIRPFIIDLGYEPVMSDYSDVLYDPRSHTHQSCVDEVSTSDCVILIVGSRFGGNAVPAAISALDVDKLRNASAKTGILTDVEKISITQLEALKAAEAGIPVYTFVERRVLHDHHVYESNKDNVAVIDKLKFPSIQKQETARYIFEFLNYMSHRSVNNGVTPFDRLDEIKNHLRVQWSQLFQKLLREDRTKTREAKRYADFSERLEDLKAVVLASIATPDLKQLAQNVIRYRHLVQFFGGIVNHDVRDLLMSEVPWDELMERIGVKEIVELEPRNRLATPIGAGRIYLLRDDGTFYICRISRAGLVRVSQEWDRFRSIEKADREAIVDAILEDRHASQMSPLRFRDEDFNQFVQEQLAPSPPLRVDVEEDTGDAT